MEHNALHLRAVNDQHITAIATIVQDVLLLLSAGLIGWYLLETRKMRKAAEDQVFKSQELVAAAQRQVDASLAQVEAASRPAVVATAKGGLMEPPVLENIGNGPAINVRWSIPNSKLGGIIPYLEPHVPRVLPIGGKKPLFEAALKTTPNAASIECAYTSLSGWFYSSSNDYDFDGDRFNAKFSPGSRS
jgi:hypothetical protein